MIHHQASPLVGRPRPKRGRSGGATNGAETCATTQIAAIPGDGIGKEVIPAGLAGAGGAGRSATAASASSSSTSTGAATTTARTARMMPADGLDALRRMRRHPLRLGRRPGHPRPHHAVGPAAADLPGLRPVRQRAADAHPARHRRAAARRARPATSTGSSCARTREGEYAGVGGRVHQGLPDEVATDVCDVDPRRRRAHHALRLPAGAVAAAQAADRGHQVATRSATRMVMWDEIAAEVAREFPDVDLGQEAGRRDDRRAWCCKPPTLDTIVATNLHADILCDLAAALAGSLGIAPTGNINPERRFPSMFEPIHGSAFDIMGKGIANPVGTFWTAVMMLEHLGEADAAARLMQAIERVTADAPASGRGPEAATGLAMPLPVMSKARAVDRLEHGGKTALRDRRCRSARCRGCRPARRRGRTGCRRAGWSPPRCRSSAAGAPCAWSWRPPVPCPRSRRESRATSAAISSHSTMPRRCALDLVTTVRCLARAARAPARRRSA